jgi:hypothetical protein
MLVLAVMFEPHLQRKLTAASLHSPRTVDPQMRINQSQSEEWNGDDFDGLAASASCPGMQEDAAARVDGAPQAALHKQAKGYEPVSEASGGKRVAKRAQAPS